MDLLYSYFNNKANIIMCNIRLSAAQIFLIKLPLFNDKTTQSGKNGLHIPARSVFVKL